MKKEDSKAHLALTICLVFIWTVLIAVAIRAWVVWDELVLVNQDEFVLAWICAHTLFAFFGTWVWSLGLRDKGHGA